MGDVQCMLTRTATCVTSVAVRTHAYGGLVVRPAGASRAPGDRGQDAGCVEPIDAGADALGPGGVEAG